MIDDKTIRLQELAYKWLNGTLTETEQLEFDLWFVHTNKEPLVIPAEIAESKEQYKQVLYSRIKQEIGAAKKRNPFPLWARLSGMAAAVLLISSIALYFYSQDKLPDQSVRFANDIKAGGNKAYLVLADGKRIVLTDAGNGKLAEQANVQINKAGDGELVYDDNGKHNVHITEYNSIETPKGGKYTVTLPDGSKIWLNAASSLKFPATFAGLKNREVELVGEAYFEVYKDSRHPFIVTTSKQSVEVLGTHFNISSYAEDSDIKTTLLEGSVRLSVKGIPDAKVLVPGEQASLANSKINIEKNVDLEEVVAWKEGYFKFNDNLENILKKVSRWYDVEIIYEKKPDPKLAFGAEISRSRNISALLKIIESTGAVHFKIEGRRIIVM